MGRKRRRRQTAGLAEVVMSSGDDSPSPLPKSGRMARPRYSRGEIAAIVARNVVPLAGLWAWGGSVENFLLLCVFNSAYAVVSLGTIGVAVSTREARQGTGWADNLAAWATLALVCIVGTLLLWAMFGWVVALMASASPPGLWNAELGWSLVAILAASVFTLALQYRRDVASGLTEAQRRQRDQPQIGGHLLSAGGILILAGYAAAAGHAGAIVMAVAVTALFVFRDLRPDLMNEVGKPDGRAT